MQWFLVVLALAGLVDAISWMVVTPSLVFYVREELGGSKEAYGLALSAFSFCSFLTKPVLGGMSDRRGFRFPLLLSFSVAVIGGLLYFLASGFAETPSRAVGILLVSRCLGGIGGGNSALGYAYLARALPMEDQTAGNTLLSLMRILGMSLGPFLNDALVDLNIPLMGGALVVGPLNAVGLAVMILNAVIFLIIYAILVDLPPVTSKEDKIGSSPQELNRVRKRSKELARAFFSLEILTPFLCTFVYNANFQLIETSFAPVAKNALDWGTVETSQVLGTVSLIIAGIMILVYVLSKKFMVADELLMGFGLSFSVVSYFFLYFSWTEFSKPWHFWFPVLLSAGAFPFLASPTVSVFSKQVNRDPNLARHQGSMQALLGMSASVAGFATPSFVASMVLKRPDQVALSPRHREITPWALYAPILSLLTLVCLVFVECLQGTIWCKSWKSLEEGEEVGTEEQIDEATPLAFRRDLHPRYAPSPMIHSPSTTLKWRRSFVGSRPADHLSSPQLTPKFQYQASGHHLMADISRTTGVHRLSSQLMNGWEQQEVFVGSTVEGVGANRILLRRNPSTLSV